MMEDGSVGRFLDIRVDGRSILLACPIQRSDFSCLELKVTLVEALRPVLARWTDTIVGRKGLEGGGTLTLDDMRYSIEKFDRNRKTTFVHT